MLQDPAEPPPRRRRDFHHEFATFRFRPLAEHGTWEGRTGIVPLS